MEDVYPRVADAHDPAVHVNEIGRGRVVYFPWDIDRTFWEILAGDHLTLMRNAVLWANNEEPLLTLDGPGVVDLAVWSQQNSIAVHLVNLTNPMMMKGPLREIIPLPAQTLRLKLPRNARPERVRLLVAGRDVPPVEDQGYVKTVVPDIGLHEVVAVDL